ncbi:MAG: NAD(P)/FAD-dependent oxidoreductase [Nitrospirota bacterium]|nr:NAD(P)/FAD-dependent oxidoreductase [Nitrospirota bacterium]
MHATSGQDDTQPHVVIVGGGFGGLYAAKALRQAPVRITLVDRRNHHLFQPLLYQVATAALNPSDIAAPIRSILRRQRNVSVILAEAASIDTQRKRVVLTDGALGYDVLILATGATHSYFGREDWRAHAPGLKSVEDALDIRRRVFLAYEAAEREPDEARRREWMTFVIIGAGPTGVEMAGALAEISRHALAHDFRRIDPQQARILLVEGLPHILPSYPPALAENARRQLARLGVEVRTGLRVTEITGTSVALGAERIGARTVIWAAGVQASPLARSLGVPLDRAGRVLVNRDLTVPGYPEIFVIGDLAALEQEGALIPGVSPAAMQEGRHAAENIRLALERQPLRPFRYRDRGSFATIGRGAAVGQVFGGLRLSGFVAWLAWVAIHIVFLVGFRNRLLVMVNWIYSYVTLQRGARLITGDPPSLT